VTITLTGFMGSGKTTVGASLARRLGLGFVDLDATIEAEHGPIRTLFADRGEEGFRDLEARALASALGPDRVLATGGGTLLRPENQARLAATRRVWLRVRWDTVQQRLAHATDRPLWDAGAHARFLARQAGYAAHADHVVDVDGRSPDDVVEAIVAALEAPCAR